MVLDPVDPAPQLHGCRLLERCPISHYERDEVVQRPNGEASMGRHRISRSRPSVSIAAAGLRQDYEARGDEGMSVKSARLIVRRSEPTTGQQRGSYRLIRGALADRRPEVRRARRGLFCRT
jgi:hypothetical protein